MRVFALGLMKYSTPTMVGALLLLLGGFSFVAVSNKYAHASFIQLDDVNSQNRTIQSQFTANQAFVAFATSTGKDKYSILVYNIKDKNWFVIKSKNYALFGPKLSYYDSGTLYFTAATPDKWNGKDSKPAKKIRDTLFKCSVKKMKCVKVFENTNSMQSPLELPNGDVLLASGIPYYGADGFNPKRKFLKFNRNDFYLLKKSKKIKRLTNLKYSSLHSIDLNGEGLFFQASSPRIFYKNKRLKEASSVPHSKIHFVKYKSLTSGTEPDSSFYKPISLVGRYAVKPASHPNTNLLAFLSADYLGGGRGSGWRYDLVIYDVVERRVVASVKPILNQSFSRPNVTSDGSVKFYEYINGIYRIFSYKVAESKKIFLGTINFAEILAAKGSRVINVK